MKSTKAPVQRSRNQSSTARLACRVAGEKVGKREDRKVSRKKRFPSRKVLPNRANFPVRFPFASFLLFPPPGRVEALLYFGCGFVSLGASWFSLRHRCGQVRVITGPHDELPHSTSIRLRRPPGIMKVAHHFTHLFAEFLGTIRLELLPPQPPRGGGQSWHRLVDLGTHGWTSSIPSRKTAFNNKTAMLAVYLTVELNRFAGRGRVVV